MAPYEEEICVFVPNINYLTRALDVFRNAGPVAVLGERGKRRTRLEALLGSHSYSWHHVVDVPVAPCHLKGCSQHFELSATILNGVVEGG
jgi:hypothetical protein